MCLVGFYKIYVAVIKMRVLYALVGEQGSGKSTFVKEHGLESASISTDNIRMMMGGVSYSWDTDHTVKGVTQNNGAAYELLHNMIISKAKQGQTIIVDSTHLYKDAFKFYKKIKENYGYKIYAVDFTHNSTGVLYRELLNRNDNREFPVPEKVLKRYWDYAEGLHKKGHRIAPGFVNVIKPSEFMDSLNWYESDLAGDYKEVKVIGDVHSCFTVLNEAIPEIKEDTLYVFLGDYLDRGTRSVDTLKWFASIADLPNVILIRGNHELHWDKLVRGESVEAPQTKRTIKELKEAMGDNYLKYIKKIKSHLQNLFMFSFADKLYLATHAGLPYDLIKKELNIDYMHHYLKVGLLPEEVFTKGIGKFNADVDTDYQENVSELDKDLPVQLHGHRNNFNIPLEDNTKIINLEQKVESGGYLAVVTLDRDGNVKREKYKNDDFDTVFSLDKLSINLDNLTNERIKEVISESRDINTKEVLPDLFANNFTSEAFFKNRFDNFSLNARGLFNDSKGEVKGRGFAKFFNVGEVPNTQLDYLMKHAKFPAEVSEKIDGFLSISFFYNGKWNIYSKGAGKQFSKMARNVVLNTVSNRLGINRKEAEYQLDKWFANHKDYSILMEIVDTKFDAHIINYANDNATVLRAIKNKYVEEDSSEFRNNFATTMGLDLPYAYYISNKEQLEDLVNSWDDLNEPTTWNREGVVITFADGKRVKVKGNWYLTRKDYIHKLNQLRNNPTFIMNKYHNEKHLSYSPIVDQGIHKIISYMCDKGLGEHAQEWEDFLPVKGLLGLNVDIDKLPAEVLTYDMANSYSIAGKHALELIDKENN